MVPFAMLLGSCGMLTLAALAVTYWAEGGF